VSSTEQSLATFVDRHTMVYDRRYEHPIQRVWEAVTTAEHLDAWMLPETRIDPRLGGVCGFGWGGEIDETNLDTITVWEPPTCVQYSATDGSFMRFDLSPDGEATRLRFTLHYLPPTDAAMDDMEGGDRPGGPDTAWRPGFLAGFHEMLDDLGPHLRGEWTRADNQAWLDRFVAEGPTAESLELQQRYRQHVIDTIPPA
jgi:uncharacterized protein YndB with AHSA1/START domain